MRTSTPTLFRAALGAAVAAALVACSSSGGSRASGDAAAEGGSSESTAAADVVYPGATWATADPASLGFDQAKLDEIAAQAQQANSNCLVVTRHGKLAAEWYWNGTDASSSQEVFSATKSYASTLVGIAQADGKLSIDDKASEYITAWQGTPSEDVTIANLISNDSGRTLSAGVDYTQLPYAPDMDSLAIGLQQEAAPGSTWGYNNSAIQTLDAVLRSAVGGDVAIYAQDKLLGPLGMAHSHMSTDAAGNTKLFMGLQSTCEDMARFGYLFLRGGNWDGDQVVPEDWVAAATGHPSQDLNDAYGYLWWLNRPGTVVGPLQATTGQAGDAAEDTQLVPGAPEDMYFALGLGNQIIAVDPGTDTVVVRLGRGLGARGGGPSFDTAAATRVVTEALVDPSE